MKQVIEVIFISTINCTLLFILSCFLADFIPDGQHDIVKHLLEFIFNINHHYNVVHFYLMSSHFQVILFYFLLFTIDYSNIHIFFNLLGLLSQIISLFVKSNFSNSTKVTFFRRLISYHKLKQDIIKAFERIP
jgi:hypothetical protein